MKKIILLFSIWGYMSFLFAQNNNINNYEYWFDNNYAGKVSDNVSPDSVIDLITNVPTTTLSNGLHTLHFRFRDENSFYSAIASQTFVKIAPYVGAENEIVTYEYWFDDNYAGRVTSNISPNASFIFLENVSTAALSNGLHTLHIRFKDSNSAYSNITSQMFLKQVHSAGDNNRIVTYEYWFNDDYAEKVAEAVSDESRLDLMTSLNTSSLSNGLHRLYMRFQDTDGRWSSVTSHTLYKNGQALSMSNKITSYRYWFDEDVANVYTISTNTSENPLHLIRELNVSQLDTGLHIIHLQFRDEVELWSIPVVDTFFMLGRPRLDEISPQKGGNTGNVTVAFYGTGFYSGTRVKLTRNGFPAILAPDSLIFIIDGQVIYATFSLDNQDTGFWNVVVEIPNDTILEIPNGFQIIEGTPVTLSSNITGFSVIRPNQWQNYSLNYTNQSNVDAENVPIWLYLPESVEIELNFNLAHPNNNYFDYDTISTYITIDTIIGEPTSGVVYPMIIPKIPPNSSGSLSYKVRTHTNERIEMRTWINPPSTRETFECLTATFDFLTNIPIVGDGVQCFAGAFNAGYDIGTLLVNGEFNAMSFIGGLASSTLDCFTLLPGSQLAIAAKAIEDWVAIPELINTGRSFHEECSGVLSSHFYRAFYTDVVTSFDPNEKIGPVGGSDLNYINRDFPLNYAIHFENVDSATAKAQTVLILDTLDTNVFNLTTFQLGFITVADTVINIPSGRKNFQTLLNLASTHNVVVRITASFDEVTGVASWLFESLDPFTLTPVANPFDGFLPPNQTAPEGEGSVHYSIKIKDDIPNDTPINNSAAIYFDNNPPILTGEWINTLDNIKPHSEVSVLPAIQTDSVFTVSWMGIDTSSGVRAYDIFYAVNNDNYRHWLINTTETSSLFTGEVDSTYHFYSIAVDWAGNLENKPNVPDASTTIRRVIPQPIITGEDFDQTVCEGPHELRYKITTDIFTDQYTVIPQGEAIQVLKPTINPENGHFENYQIIDEDNYIILESIDGNPIPPGEYYVGLMVRNSQNGAVSEVVTLTLTINSLPDAVIDVPTEIICPGSDAVFSITGTPSAVVTYKINNGVEQQVTLNNEAIQIIVPGVSENVAIMLVTIEDPQTGCVGALTVVDTVLIGDIEAPEISCPESQTLLLDNDCAAALPDYTSMALTSDNCGVYNVMQLPAPETLVQNEGIMEVMLTVHDVNGLTASCLFSVSKSDYSPPEVTCSDLSISFNGQTSIAISPNDLLTASDNCGIATITITPDVVNCTQIGQMVPVTAVVKDFANNTATCSSLVNVAGLPCGWNQQPNGIGCPGGSSIIYNPTSSIWTAISTNCFYGSPFNSDITSFVQRTLCGDGSITARVTSISESSGWAGIMMRESNYTGAKKAQLMTNLSTLSRREFRLTTDGQAFPQQFSSLNRYWLRIVRTGNQFSMYTSPNGEEWYIVGTQYIQMENCIQMGLVATNYSANSTVIAVFNNVGYTGSNSSGLIPPIVTDPAISSRETIDFELFPNPTTGMLNLDLGRYADREVRIEVYSLQGQLLQFTEIPEVQIAIEQIDISSLAQGMYLVRVKSVGLPNVVHRVILSQKY